VASKSSHSPESPAHGVGRELGLEVRSRRRALHLTQATLAQLAGCGPDFVYDLERGKPTVRLDKLIEVLAVLGLELKVVSRGGTSHA
jgi:y4mF family transcriptional regulator